MSLNSCLLRGINSLLKAAIMKNNKIKLTITDDFKDLDNRDLSEEIALLLPYAEELLAPLTKTLTKKTAQSKLKASQTLNKEK